MSNTPKLPAYPEDSFFHVDIYGAGSISELAFQVWYKETFKNAVQVNGWNNGQQDVFTTGDVKQGDTMTALLINVQPIKQRTAEDVLQEWVNRIENAEGLTAENMRQAKAVLEKK